MWDPRQAYLDPQHDWLDTLIEKIKGHIWMFKYTQAVQKTQLGNFPGGVFQGRVRVNWEKVWILKVHPRLTQPITYRYTLENVNEISHL